MRHRRPPAQSVLDALADAATLRRLKGRTGPFHPLRCTKDWGEGAVEYMKAGDADRAAACAAAAAHEAFGYCPSLREEARSSAPGEELGSPQGPAAMEALEPVPTTGQERSR